LTAQLLRWADLSAVPGQLQLPALQRLALVNCSPVEGGSMPPSMLVQLPALTSLILARINSPKPLRARRRALRCPDPAH
jgi:hypothetical protein